VLVREDPTQIKILMEKMILSSPVKEKVLVPLDHRKNRLLSLQAIVQKAPQLGALSSGLLHLEQLQSMSTILRHLLPPTFPVVLTARQKWKPGAELRRYWLLHQELHLEILEFLHKLEFLLPLKLSQGYQHLRHSPGLQKCVVFARIMRGRMSTPAK
jgi:hypothetical protein